MSTKFSFVKYSATGNDFIIADNRQGHYNNWDIKKRKKLCHRQLGIGADGILFLENPTLPHTDYKMRYFNSDGGECSMCGNGARALGLFAFRELKLGPKQKNIFSFETQNGVYQFTVKNNDEISLAMTELKEINEINVQDLYPKAQASFYMNTGVPHAIFLLPNIDELNVVEIAPKMAHDPRFKTGSNINFFEIVSEKKIKIRTFERGVENETLSCGTGIVAVSYFCHLKFSWKGEILVMAKGGELKVNIESNQQVFFSGKVDKIFSGETY